MSSKLTLQNIWHAGGVKLDCIKGSCWKCSRNGTQSTQWSIITAIFIMTERSLSYQSLTTEKP